VTKFLIRRQCFRDISTTSFSWLLRSLPSLQSLRRETWRLITLKERGADDRSYALQVGTRLTRKKQDESRFFFTVRLPRSLTHLQLFEDFEIQLYGKKDAL
jgi:hypothetical protein